MQEHPVYSSEIPDFFVPALRSWGIEVEEEQLLQFLKFQQLLIEWNTKFNLTAITDPIEVFRKHFLDSLSLLQVCCKKNISLLDIGTGAGFPGIPLKIIMTHWDVSLLEATGKKVHFTEVVIESLQLSGIKSFHGRAEEWERTSIPHPLFDVITGRAVTQMSKFLIYAAPFLKPDGKVILYKKGEIQDELKYALQTSTRHHLELEQIHSFNQEGLSERLLVIWQRTR